MIPALILLAFYLAKTSSQRTGTSSKDRGGPEFQVGGYGNSQGQLDSRQSNLIAVNLTHALAVDQGIAAAGGGEESYINILR